MWSFSFSLQLRYDQFRSPFGEPIVQECRGLILDEKENWKLVAYPYKKFFNYQEKYAAELDWKNITVYEKVDGSIATLY
jgi:tRNA splicing ligase